jgi:hypothetical protein
MAPLPGGLFHPALETRTAMMTRMMISAALTAGLLAAPCRAAPEAAWEQGHSPAAGLVADQRDGCWQMRWSAGMGGPWTITGEVCLAVHQLAAQGLAEPKLAEQGTAPHGDMATRPAGLVVALTLLAGEGRLGLEMHSALPGGYWLRLVAVAGAAGPLRLTASL